MTVKRGTNKRRSYKRKMMKMKGGAFSEEEHQVLANNGFTQDQINELQQLNVEFETIIERIEQITNESDLGFSGNSDGLTQQVLNSFQNGNINMDLDAAIPQNHEDVHELDMTLDDNMFDDGGPMHLDDLEANSVNSSLGYTSSEESDFLTNKRRTNKRRTNKRRTNKRRTNKRRTNKRSKK